MMLRKYLLLLFIPAILFTGCAKDEEVNPDIEPPKTQEPVDFTEKILEADWETKALSDAVVWKYYHFDDLFSSNQSITVFEIDLNDERLTTDIPFVETGFLKTSEGAKMTRATVAVNGSYFNTSEGGSTVFFKKNGEIINETRTGFTPYRENAGFAIDAAGAISVIKKPAGGWASVEEAHTLLASGPLLVYDNAIVDQVDAAFNNNRHPRTAVGITADNHLIAVVVDGRASEAHGMTIKELATVMHAFGCVEAMNLDGGGSSTAYVINRGVVNYPSDNKKFDHEGERGVATVIVFVEE